jgi:anti-sigma regulatory factor (Ser/Thr protein kinase)
MKFWIRNVPEHVSEAANRIASACAKAGLDPLRCYQATTCAVEAINNAIAHAYREHSGYIAVRWRCSDDTVVIEIADQGVGMETPPDAEPSDPRAERGRGWLIIREWMDEVAYEQRENENVVIMAKHLPNKAASTRAMA